MADEPKARRTADAETDAERKAREDAAKAEAAKTAEADAARIAEAGAEATTEARQQDAETLKQQEAMRPYPSQEEADAIKSAAAAGAAPYATRQLKP